MEKKQSKASEILDKITKMGIFTIVGITVILGIIYGVTGSNFIVGKDISGWASLVISGGVGIFITIIVVIYSNYQQEKLTGIITSIDKILLEQKKSNDQRRIFAIQRLKDEISILDGWVHIIVEMSAEYWHVALDRSSIDHTIDEMRINSMFQVYDKERAKILRNLESIMGFSNEVLGTEIIGKVDSIIKLMHNPIVSGNPPYPSTMVLQVEWSEPISKLIKELKSIFEVNHNKS